MAVCYRYSRQPICKNILLFQDSFVFLLTKLSVNSTVLLGINNESTVAILPHEWYTHAQRRSNYIRPRARNNCFIVIWIEKHNHTFDTPAYIVKLTFQLQNNLCCSNPAANRDFISAQQYHLSRKIPPCYCEFFMCSFFVSFINLWFYTCLSAISLWIF